MLNPPASSTGKRRVALAPLHGLGPKSSFAIGCAGEGEAPSWDGPI